MFKKAKKGDEVWAISMGWGKITEVHEDSISVKFKNESLDFLYLKNGKIDKTDINPSLFWDEVKIEIPKKSKEYPIVNKNVYAREIKGVVVDAYDILNAYKTNNPAIDHALKKMLVSGGRNGGKSRTQDIKEAIASLNRALELEN